MRPPVRSRHPALALAALTWCDCRTPDNDPDRDAKLDRIEEVLEKYPDRCFAFDEFGPLAIHPSRGCCWGARKKPQRLRANYHKTCGVRQFHACYSYGDDTLWVWCGDARA